VASNETVAGIAREVLPINKPTRYFRLYEQQGNNDDDQNKKYDIVRGTVPEIKK